MRKELWFYFCLFLGVFVFAATAQAQSEEAKTFCEQHAALCTEPVKTTDYEGNYVGHDEPALLFYSNKKGSGNSNVYFITLPNEPPTLPNQGGTAGTFNFQLRPALWFGMAMCDSESFPNFTKVCAPNTDDNIFDEPLSSNPKWIGHHPGTAFMEMQFYPPGWVKWPFGNSCDAHEWCAALNIDSVSENLTDVNNTACLRAAGVEYVNFAFVTKNGVALDAARPDNHSFLKFTPDPAKVLLMNPGDTLKVVMRDTATGFRVDIFDLNTGEQGSMTASLANGFAQVKFEPTSPTCHIQPYAFHPMYATSSEHTRVPWAAHSFNIAFSDEIGHFEYCSGITGFFSLRCPATGGDPPGGRDADDFFCFGPSASSRVQIGGCVASDIDFDGPVYNNNWPGTLTNAAADRELHPSAVHFTSPLFFHRESDDEEREVELKNYDRVAFETDLPRIEAADLGGTCDRLTGVGCVNPPVGATFYPIYTTTESEVLKQCVWQLGGSHIPGTRNLFGGTSTAEYGSLLLLDYPVPTPPGFIGLFNNFRQILHRNPCKVKLGELEDD